MTAMPTPYISLGLCSVTLRTSTIEDVVAVAAASGARVHRVGRRRARRAGRSRRRAPGAGGDVRGGLAGRVLRLVLALRGRLRPGARERAGARRPAGADLGRRGRLARRDARAAGRDRAAALRRRRGGRHRCGSPRVTTAPWRGPIDLAFELHGGTLTDDFDSALALVAAPACRATGSRRRTCPTTRRSRALRRLAPVPAVHVFSWWPGSTRLRLRERAALWRAVFAEFRSGDALLEFVPGRRSGADRGGGGGMSRVAVVLMMRPDLPARLFDPERLATVADGRRTRAQAEVVLSGWGCPPLDAELLAGAPSLRAIVHAAGGVKGHVTDACWERGLLVRPRRARTPSPSPSTRSRGSCWRARRPTGWRASTPRAAPRSTWSASSRRSATWQDGRDRGRVADRATGDRAAAAVRLARARQRPLRRGERRARRAAGGQRHRQPARAVAAVDAPHARRPPACAAARRRDADQHRPRRADRPGRARRRAGERAHRRGHRRHRAGGPSARLAALRPPNVVLTPHIAGALGVEVRRLGASALDELERYARGEPFAHPVTRDDLAASPEAEALVTFRTAT